MESMLRIFLLWCSREYWGALWIPTGSPATNPIGAIGTSQIRAEIMFVCKAGSPCVTYFLTQVLCALVFLVMSGGWVASERIQELMKSIEYLQECLLPYRICHSSLSPAGKSSVPTFLLWVVLILAWLVQTFWLAGEDLARFRCFSSVFP